MSDTTIDSQIDGNGATVPNGTGTTSDKITFEFSGETSADSQELNIERYGFECYLDGNGGGGWQDCIKQLVRNELKEEGSSITYYPDDDPDHELALGPHFFLVRAYVVIEVGEENFVTIRDPSPERFEWTILPDTRIESAEDENGQDILNNTSTSSTTINFTFVGLKDDEVTDEVDGFQCKLDNQNFEECDSPKIYSVTPGTSFISSAILY